LYKENRNPFRSWKWVNEKKSGHKFVVKQFCQSFASRDESSEYLARFYTFKIALKKDNLFLKILTGEF